MPTAFLQNPRYQRALKRLQRLDPSQRAILSTDELMRVIANEEGRRQLAYMSLGEQKKSRLQRGELAREGLAIDRSRLGLRKNILNYEKKRGNKAEIYGWANVGLGGYAGWMDLKEKEALAKRMRGLSELYNASLTG